MDAKTLSPGGGIGGGGSAPAAGYHFGAISTDAAVGAVDAGSVAMPTVDWPGQASVVRLLAALTLSPGATDWTPSGVSDLSTRIDPGASGSTLDGGVLATSAAIDVAGEIAAVASGLVAFTVGYSDGTNVTSVGMTQRFELITGHPFMRVRPTPAGSLYVLAAVTLGATPPTITDAAGFTWTQREQLALDGALLTIWTAPISTAVTVDTDVQLSETVDSGICFGLHP